MVPNAIHSLKSPGGSQWRAVPEGKRSAHAAGSANAIPLESSTTCHWGDRSRGAGHAFADGAGAATGVVTDGVLRQAATIVSATSATPPAARVSTVDRPCARHPGSSRSPFTAVNFRADGVESRRPGPYWRDIRMTSQYCRIFPSLNTLSRSVMEQISWIEREYGLCEWKFATPAPIEYDRMNWLVESSGSVATFA
jgi:hypothetical protein